MKQVRRRMPLVSVVMTVYNGAQYLREALQSVFMQTYQNFEIIIVVEYGTNDQTTDILKSIKDSRLKVIFNEKKLGISHSLNIGLKAAQGKYIARLDDDDIWIKNKLERQVTLLEKHPDLGMCGSNAYIIDDKDKIVNVKVYPDKSQVLKMSLYIANCFVSSAVVMRNSIIKKHGLRYSGNVCEDYWLWIKISMYSEVSSLPDFLVGYRVFEGNRTNYLIKKQAERDRDIHKLLWEKVGIGYPFDKSFYSRNIKYQDWVRKYRMLIELSHTLRFRNMGANSLIEVLYWFQSITGKDLYGIYLPEVNYLFKFKYYIFCNRKKMEQEYYEKKYIERKCNYK